MDWRIFLKTILLSFAALFGLVVLVSLVNMATGGAVLDRDVEDVVAIDDASLAPAPPRAAPRPPPAPAPALKPHPWIEVGGVYVTFGLDYISAETEAQLRQGLRITGDEGRIGAANTAALERAGIRWINGRHKVRVLAISPDGQRVHLEGVRAGDRFWTVAEGIAMPVVDQDRKRVLVGGTYAVARPAAGVAEVEDLERADTLISAAMPERDLFDPRRDEDWALAVREVAAEHSWLTELPSGHVVTIEDFDTTSGGAVLVKPSDAPAGVWVYAHHLSRHQEGR